MTGLLAAVGCIAIIIFLICVAYESPGFATLSFIASLAAAEFIFGLPVIDTIKAQPLSIVAFAAVYLLAGIAWSIPKWWFHVRNLRDEYLEAIQKFLDQEGANIKAEDFDFEGELGDHWSSYNAPYWDNKIPPRASENKSRILTWVLYWPFSMVWTIIDEPFRRAFTMVFERIRGLYQRISESAFSDVPIKSKKNRKIRRHG